MDRNLLEKDYKKASNQLFQIDCRKSKIKKEIYGLYNLYLTIIRSKLQNYLGEAIIDLVDVSKNGISLKDQKTTIFIKNDLKKIVNKILPFLTIEQLSIKTEYKTDNSIKNNREFESSYNLKEEINTTKNIEKIHTNNSIIYYKIYYKNIINEDNFKNINLDNFIFENKSSDSYKKDESLRLINSTILLKDCIGEKLSINIHQCEDSKYFIPTEFKDILIWLDTLDSSLNLYLQDLSIEINNELHKKNISKTTLNDDLLFYIFENHLLFSNPSPFILTFDQSFNQYINFEEINYEDKFSKINLININSAELEFININLSILKNKLLEIKSNIYLLIKKENYWFNKLQINSKKKPILNKI